MTEFTEIHGYRFQAGSKNHRIALDLIENGYQLEEQAAKYRVSRHIIRGMANTLCHRGATIRGYTPRIKLAPALP